MHMTFCSMHMTSGCSISRCEPGRMHHHANTTDYCQLETFHKIFCLRHCTCLKWFGRGVYRKSSNSYATPSEAPCGFTNIGSNKSAFRHRILFKGLLVIRTLWRVGTMDVQCSSTCSQNAFWELVPDLFGQVLSENQSWRSFPTQEASRGIFHYCTSEAKSFHYCTTSEAKTRARMF